MTKHDVIVDELPRMRKNADLILHTCDYGDLRHRAHYEVRVVNSTERGVYCCDDHLEECRKQLETRGW